MSMLNQGRRSRHGIATTAKRSPLRRGLVAALFVTVLTIGVVGAPKASRADFQPAPEIDPSSMAGALTMLVGGILALTDRARRSA